MTQRNPAPILELRNHREVPHVPHQEGRPNLIITPRDHDVLVEILEVTDAPTVVGLEVGTHTVEAMVADFFIQPYGHVGHGLSDGPTEPPVAAAQ